MKIINRFKLLSWSGVNLFIVFLSVIFGVFLGWQDMEIIIFAIFIASILWSFPSRYFAIPALFFLAMVPFLLLVGDEERAEELAIYSYYFVVLAVFMGVLEIWKNKIDNNDKGK